MESSVLISVFFLFSFSPKYQVLVCHWNGIYLSISTLVKLFLTCYSFVKLLLREETEISHTINFDLIETLNNLPLYCYSIDTVILHGFNPQSKI
jgi:hypothetical protein